MPFITFYYYLSL